MQMHTNPIIVNAAVNLLKPYCPALTETALLDVLRSISTPAPKTAEALQPPLTRKEAARLLSVSLNTLNRYMNNGLVRKIKVGPRHVLVDPASLQALLKKASEPCE